MCRVQRVQGLHLEVGHAAVEVRAGSVGLQAPGPLQGGLDDDEGCQRPVSDVGVVCLCHTPPASDIGLQMSMFVLSCMPLSQQMSP